MLSQDLQSSGQDTLRRLHQSKGNDVDKLLIEPFDRGFRRTNEPCLHKDYPVDDNQKKRKSCKRRIGHIVRLGRRENAGYQNQDRHNQDQCPALEIVLPPSLSVRTAGNQQVERDDLSQEEAESVPLRVPGEKCKQGIEDTQADARFPGKRPHFASLVNVRLNTSLDLSCDPQIEWFFHHPNSTPPTSNQPFSLPKNTFHLLNTLRHKKKLPHFHYTEAAKRVKHGARA